MRTKDRQSWNRVRRCAPTTGPLADAIVAPFYGLEWGGGGGGGVEL